MLVEYRKLQKTPDGTYFVTIPKNWIVSNHMKRGDMIRFERTFNGRLTLSLHALEERALKKSSLELSPYLERLIAENYLSGSDIIEIKSTAILSPEARERVKKALKRYVGLEIVEEDSKRIVIQCLLGPSLIIPDKVSRRIHAISSEMEKDSISSFINEDKALAETVIERDEEVNRQYFLLVRLVRTALTYPHIAEKLSVSPIECLDYRMLASLIEHYADYSVDIANASLKARAARLPRGLKKEFLKVNEGIYEIYTNSFTSVLKRDLELALQVSNESCNIKNKLNEIENSILESKQPDHEILTNIIIALNSMCEVCLDISDLAKAK